MNKLTKLACLSLFLLFSASISSAAPKDYRYTTVPNDPLKARIYTLDNGLKVYMTVNKETPRIKPTLPYAWAERMTRRKPPVWHTTLNT